MKSFVTSTSNKVKVSSVFDGLTYTSKSMLPFDTTKFLTSYAIEPEVQDWLRRVALAGASISTAETTAVNKFVKSIKAAGLWFHLTDVGVFVGSLAASLVKLVYTGSTVPSLTNTGYTQADYGSNGIVGKSASYLNTQYSIPTLSIYDWHACVYQSTFVGAGPVIGSSYTATGNADRFYTANNGQWGIGAAFGSVTMAQGLMAYGMKNSASDGVYLYVNANRLVNTSSAGIVFQQVGQVMIFAAAGSFGGNNSTMSFYSIGKGFTPTEYATYYTIVKQLQTDLGRP